MKVWAISDLHLSTSCNKPMDVFGGNWLNYVDKIKENWCKLVSNQDIVCIAGDISWAMKIEEAISDLKWIDDLPGHKIIIKGNHEYWWKSISAVRDVLPKSISAIQNDCIRFGNILFCGTRGWTVAEHGKTLSAEDEKLYKREVERLKLTLKQMQNQRKPDDIVICMIHYPPFNMTKQDSGFTQLIEEYKINKVIYGHLHGKLVNIEHVFTKNDVTYYFTSTDHINNTPVLILD